MLIMHGLRHLPKRLNNSQEAKYFLLVSLGLNWPKDHSDVLNRVEALLADPNLAYKLRDNMIEFYMGLTPEYIGGLYLETYRDTGLTLFEFKYRVIRDIVDMPLDTWVLHQVTRVMMIESWDSI